MNRIRDVKQYACSVIDDLAEDLHHISKGIWENPELCFEEHKSHDLLTSYLEKKYGKVERHFVCETGFRYTYGSKDGPHVAVLCEYDALPEIGHACGHNLIAEVGIGAGIAIVETLKNMEMGGKITILGTPAEEGGGGKINMINANVFDDVDVALMAHPFTVNCLDLSSGVLASCWLWATYKGKASHAAAFPWEGRNALDAAVLAYNNVACLRQQMKPDWRVSGIISNGGAKPNIIPEEAALTFIVRGSTMQELHTFLEKIKACLNAAALATGCDVEITPTTFDHHRICYANMVSNRPLEALYTKNVSELGVNLDNPVGSPSIFAASTDMGNVSHVVPSIHPWFAIGTGDFIHTRPFTTAAGSDEAQPHTLVQAKLLAMTAMDVYCDKGILTKIKESFDKDPRKEK